MSAMIYDQTEQAFKEAEVPMKFDQDNQSWADTTGLAYNPDAEAWEEKWSAVKGFKGYLIKNGVLQIPNEFSTFIYNNGGSGWGDGSFSVTDVSGYKKVTVTTGYCYGGLNVYKTPLFIKKGSILHSIVRRDWGNRVGIVALRNSDTYDGKYVFYNDIRTSSGDEHIISDPLDADYTLYLSLDNSLQETSGTSNMYVKDVWIE